MMQLRVRDLLKDPLLNLPLEVVAGEEGLDNRITHPRIQKHGLALAGYLEYVHPQRVQILGQTEISYLATLTARQREERLGKFCSLPIACFIVTKSLPVPSELIDFAGRWKIAVLHTSVQSSECIAVLSDYLEDRLAPRTSIHGVLMDIYGVGVLILGKSGIGKSESALHLVVKGHRLVADDIVEIRRLRGELTGAGAEFLKYHMEIRGLGIINVKDLFGVSAIQEKKKIDMVIQLDAATGVEDEERLGLEDETYAILDVALPFLRTPVRPGRNIPTIIEVAARNQLLKVMGYHSAREFDRRLLERLRNPGNDAAEGD